MKASMVCSAVAAFAFSVSCASGEDSTNYAGSAGQGGALGGAPGTGGAVNVGGASGAGPCGTALDAVGCLCAPGSEPRTCYPGLPATRGVGACKDGVQSCTESSGPEVSTFAWGACSGHTLPDTETCDGVDNDCDGAADETCTDGGCAPTSCAAQGKNCGSIPDGCGGFLDCGTCTAPAACGGSGQPGVCGGGSCVPTSCGAQGKNCGTTPDGCGGVLACGACPAGQTCNASNVCTPNPVSCPAVVASSQGDIIELAVSGSALYWVDQTPPRSIRSVPLAGGPVTVLATGLPGASAADCSLWWSNVAVDASRVYWALGIQNPGTDPLALGKVSLGGGALTPVAPGTFSASDIATNGATVAWVTADTVVHASPATGGADKVIAQYTGKYAHEISLDAANAYVITKAKSDASQAALEKVPLSGGAPTVLTPISGGTNPYTLRLHAGFAYWIGGSSVQRAPTAGGPAQTLATPPAGSTYGWTLAVDDSGVFFSELSASPSLVRKVALTGGAAKTVAQVSAPQSWLQIPVAVGPSCVYWVTRTCGNTTVIASAPK